MRALCILLLLVPLAGCAMFRPIGGSWVEPTAESEAEPLSETIVAFVAEFVPQAGAAIELVAPPERQAANMLTLQLRSKLAARGYKLEAQGAGARHRLKYVVSRFGDRLLLRVALDGVEASVLFGWDDGGALRAAGPLSMRKQGQVL